MVCLDTDIMIDFLRNETSAVKKIKEFRSKNLDISTTSINTFELFKGAMRSNQDDALEILNNFLSNLKILNFNEEVSKKAADIFENLRKRGELIDPLDLMIASIVIKNKEILLTNNLSHFKRISELQLA